ncbi:putative bacteriophage baseplate protein [Salmonella enterica subsp. enterica serovar Typhi]|nr:putative bacteriophage baseplate protein [Salmonella enterica subsp. enterica serovar Typhi]
MTGVTRQIGTVSAVDADRVQARVRLPECDNLRTNWLNVLQRNTQDNKDYWLPDVGEQVEVLLDANGEDGVILGAVYSDVDKPPFSDKNVRGTKYADGAEFSYNRATHTLTVRGVLSVSWWRLPLISLSKGKTSTSRELPRSTAPRHSMVIWKSTEAPMQRVTYLLMVRTLIHSH